MKESVRTLGAIGLGAGAMYLLDPDRGRRRRALVRDKTVRAVRKTEEAVGITARDMANRSRGIVHELGAALRSEEISDEGLVDRVRSRLGRSVSHPRAVEVEAIDGDVVLRGKILARELNALLKSVSKVRGVRAVRSELEVHSSADVSELQGGRRRPGNQIDIAQEHWAPATRFLAGALGSALAIIGLRTGGVVGGVLAAGGGTLVARSMTNTELRRMVRMEEEESSQQTPLEEPGAATTRREALAEMG